MNWLRKVPGSVRAASGLEWSLWRKLPWIALAGTLVPLLGLGLLHAGVDATVPRVQRQLQVADYAVLGWVVFHWTAVLTAAIGCVVVMVMKGPAYAADSYAVSHSDRPRARSQSEDAAPG